MTQEKPRWIYRFDNYSRAYALLAEAVTEMTRRSLSQLEKEGVIQRFEYTWELAWKLLKDLLDDGGVVLDAVTPKHVVRAAFTASIIANGEGWMQALDARNLMSHTYNIRDFEKIVAAIRSDYLPLFAQLETFCRQKTDA